MVMSIEEHNEITIFSVLRDCEDRVASKLSERFKMIVHRVEGGFRAGQLFIPYDRAFQLTK
mgnify:CR=1 FL=1